MNYFTGADPRHFLAQLRKERSIEIDLVPDHMNNDNAERQCFEIVLVLESAIGGYEYITFQLPYQHMVFQMLPAEIKKGLDLMVRKCLDQPWID